MKEIKINNLLKFSLLSITAVALVSIVAPTFTKAENNLLKNSKMEIVKKDNKKILLNRISTLPMIKKAKLVPEKVVETNDMYYVMFSTPNGQRAAVYISKDLKLMIHSGQGISTETGVPYSPPKDMSAFVGKESFSYGTGSKVLYVFTDPECPYCKKFEKKWDSLKEKYTFKVFILPILPKYHLESPEMAHWLMSAKTDKEKSKRLIELANGSKSYKGFMKNESVEQYKAIEKDLKIIKELAGNNEISGTPTVLDLKGNPVNWTTLK